MPLLYQLELQHIIRAQHLFLFDAEVDSGNAGIGINEESEDFDERNLACPRDDASSKIFLPMVLRSEWVEKCSILRLYFFFMSFRRTLILWTE